MKKIIMITAVIVVATVAAQAQVPNVEVCIADAGFKAFALGSSSGKKSSPSFQEKVERQVSAAVAKQQTQAAKTQKTKDSKKKASQATKKTSQKIASVNNDSGVIAWVKAIALGGPLPGESAQSYHLRLEAQSYPASQPYK